ncbi:hypothetical protein [Bordetella sp. N]|nr:hypothetical protein [Bordetella sp. N]
MAALLRALRLWLLIRLFLLFVLPKQKGLGEIAKPFCMFGCGGRI